MQRFFQLFCEAPIPTRFDKCIELKQIAETLTRLRNKEYELQKASAAGAGSPDYAKYTVITNLLREIDSLIAEFNANDEHADHAEEVRDMIALIDAITRLIAHSLEQHRETLNIFRNKNRENAATTFRSAAFASTLLVFFATPLSFIPRLATIFGIGYAENSIEAMTGLNSRITRSLGLLTEFHAMLREAKINLEFAVYLGRNDGERVIQAPAQANNNLLFVYTPMTRAYIENIRKKPVQISDKLKQLNLTNEEEALFEDYKCPISLEVMNIPVLVGMHEFELDEILALPIDENDQRTCPLTRYKFYVRDIHPTKTYDQILETIKTVENLRQLQVLDKNVVQPAPSAPPMNF